MIGRAIVILLAVLVLAAPLWAEPTEPPTKFQGGYVKPTATQPPPRSNVWAYVDVVVLVEFLALAVIFVHWMRSRRAMMMLSVAALAYFGFWRGGCVCAIGAIQNLSLALADPTYAVPIPVLAFLALPLVFALFAGRVFCGGVCPLGAIQDLVLVRPFRLPPALDAALRLGATVYLLLAVVMAVVGAAFVICQYDPFVGFFRLSAGLPVLIFGGAVLALATVIGRPYCRYACPLGVLLGHAARLAKQPVQITPAGCINCRLCEDACPFGAIRKPAPAVRPGARARWAMAAALLSLPLFGGAGVAVGFVAGPALSQVHPAVRDAQQVWADESSHTQSPADATRALHKTHQELADMLARADGVRRQFVIASAVAGGLFGLAVAGRLVLLSIRRRRDEYETDRADCLACGRCFNACPVHRADSEGLPLPERQEAT